MLEAIRITRTEFGYQIQAYGPNAQEFYTEDGIEFIKVKRIYKTLPETFFEELPLIQRCASDRVTDLEIVSALRKAFAEYSAYPESGQQ